MAQFDAMTKPATEDAASMEPASPFRSEAQKNADAIKVLHRLRNLRGATEACERAIQALQKDDHGAALIGQTIPDVADTEPRLSGEKVYNRAKALCYGVAGRAAGITSGFDITDRERTIIDAIAEWMGSRDCEIVRLKTERGELLRQLFIKNDQLQRALADGNQSSEAIASGRNRGSEAP